MGRDYLETKGNYKDATKKNITKRYTLTKKFKQLLFNAVGI